MQADLVVGALAAPAVLVVRPVRHHEEHAGGRKALDHAVEERLGLGVDPVKVLDNQQERLCLALHQEQALDRVESTLAALRGIEKVPLRIVDGRAEKREESREVRFQQPVVPENLARHPLADS